MPPGPFDDDLDEGTRQDLGRRLRDLLAHDELDVRGMAQGLAVEPELVVTALREVRALPGGRLRSTIRLGRVAWTWEPAPAPDDGASPGDEPGSEPGDTTPARRGKDRRGEDTRPSRSGKQGKSKGKKG